MTTKAIQGPRWDITTEYKSLKDTTLEADLARASELIQAINALTGDVRESIPAAESLSPDRQERLLPIVQKISILRDEARVLIENVDAYASALSTINGRDTLARATLSRTQALRALFLQAVKPHALFLTRVSEDFIHAYLNHPVLSSEAFLLSHARKQRERLLPLDQETILLAYGVDGHTAWGNLYNNLAGTLTCQVKVGKTTKTMGLSEAQTLLESPKPAIRKAAYTAINTAWEGHAESASAILNALTGWRLETARRRSHTRATHYLDPATHEALVSRETLDAMFEAVSARKDIGRRAMTLTRRALKQKTMGPWDLFAPIPTTGKKAAKKLTFAQGASLVSKAFDEVHPQMGEFARHMFKMRWVDASVGPTKRPGAYCMDFIKSRTPRVFLTYTGGMNEVSTLAHELGHAFHSWVMRDLPLAQLGYPMTLAETASIFAEAVVKDAMASESDDPAALRPIFFAEANDAAAFLLNIPARFDFERALNEVRASRQLSVTDMKELMTKSWKDWYGPTLSEMNPWFWASKMHFHLAELSFYNFPYTFGYLFSLGVYAQRATQGKNFYANYVALLRDTARMSCEDVAKKHLGVDLTRPDFWNASLDIVSSKLDTFEKLLTRT
jgi:oligoendopeptidase F